MRVKKLVYVAVIAVVCLNFGANAMNDNALGVRICRGAELNYQRALGGGTRLELGASWAHGGDFFGLRASYHVLHRNIEGGFNWYLGPDAYIALTNDPQVHGRFKPGIEHDFNVSGVPLLISLDAPIGIQIIPSTGLSWDIGLGIRWTF
ncbi:MAG: hypothetical protein LBU70_01195 [Chitinispirillales bacterium]|jgi:hypothetical protein|nr:hypothetical protein [Chitinispirillales bacterium]